MQRQLSEYLALTDRVTNVIARTQKLAPETVTISKTFEELNIDSLDGINILFALEGEFNIDIPDDAARNIKTIREMVDGVAALLAAKAAKQDEQAKSASPVRERGAESSDNSTKSVAATNLPDAARDTDPAA